MPLSHAQTGKWNTFETFHHSSLKLPKQKEVPKSRTCSQVVLVWENSQLQLKKQMQILLRGNSFNYRPQILKISSISAPTLEYISRIRKLVFMSKTQQICTQDLQNSDIGIIKYRLKSCNSESLSSKDTICKVLIHIYIMYSLIVLFCLSNMIVIS